MLVEHLTLSGVQLLVAGVVEGREQAGDLVVVVQPPVGPRDVDVKVSSVGIIPVVVVHYWVQFEVSVQNSALRDHHV